MADQISSRSPINEKVCSTFNNVSTSANSFTENQVQNNATLTNVSIQSSFPIQQSNNLNAATGNPSYSRAILNDQQTPALLNVENLQLVVGNAMNDNKSIQGIGSQLFTVNEQNPVSTSNCDNV